MANIKRTQREKYIIEILYKEIDDQRKEINDLKVQIGMYESHIKRMNDLITK